MDPRLREFYRKWAYSFFAVTLLAFVGGLIPGLFSGNLALTAISGVVILVSSVASVLLGRVGFVEEAPPPDEQRKPVAREKIQWAPLDPDDTAFDDANWLYTRGEDVGPAGRSSKEKEHRSPTDQHRR